MTVRTWFRLLRRSAWEADRAVMVKLYFRDEGPYGPLSSPVSLIDFKDLQRFAWEPIAPVHVLDQTWPNVWQLSSGRVKAMENLTK